MEFIPDQIFFLHNRGHNDQPIFFTEANYDYFLEKMERHLSPFANILAYCLLPNEFFWLLHLREESCFPSRAVKSVSARKDHRDLPATDFYQSALCNAIRILLSSYARAVNKQEIRSGSLFRGKTRARNYEMNIPMPGMEDGRVFDEEAAFASFCTDLIHRFPVTDGLVPHPSAWPYSSWRSHQEAPAAHLSIQGQAGARPAPLASNG